MRFIPGVVFHWPGSNKSEIIHKPGEALVEHFRYIHTQRNGWSDIGYHYVIHRNAHGVWGVYDGRPDVRTGAHSGTRLGNQHIGINVAYGIDEKLPIEAVRVAAQLVADLAKKYGFGINHKTILGHREIIPTQCPGDDLQNALPHIINQAISGISKAKPVLVHEPDIAREDEQLSKIKLTLNGDPAEGLRVNNQAFIHVSKLGALGLNVTYDKQTDTVRISNG